MIHRFFSAVLAFFRSFSKSKPVVPTSKTDEVDEVARSFYKNLMDAESKTNRHS
jgi:hypothetical protein